MPALMLLMALLLSMVTGQESLQAGEPSQMREVRLQSPDFAAQAPAPVYGPPATDTLPRIVPKSGTHTTRQYPATLSHPAGRQQHNTTPFRTSSWNRVHPPTRPVVHGQPAESPQPGTVPPVPQNVVAPADAKPATRPPQFSATTPRRPASAPALRVRGGHSHGIYPGVSRLRANVEQDAANWMTPYRSRANAAMPQAVDTGVAQLPPITDGWTAWWDDPVRAPTGMALGVLPVRLQELVQKAVLHSPQVLAVKAEPNVQYHIVGQEQARFDWTTFLESTFDDLKDPVGNELALGVPGLDRLEDKKYSAAGGIRRRTRSGAEVEISQQIGRQRQNSRFFTPNPQGSARLEIQYRQPLMNGAGAVVNESQILLARIAANASEDDVVDAIQEHLVQVTEAYWMLYRARAEYFQRLKLLQSAEGVLRKLEGRNEVDTVPRQILRARAAVARAQTGIQRTLARVHDAEAQLRLLVNSPELQRTGSVEMIPQVPPTMVTPGSELRLSLDSALQNRPDISAAIREMRTSGVRLGVSRNELLPRLDVIVSSYVSDITRSSIQRSVRGQFLEARPSYSVGFEFELPMGNRAAKSRLEQRKWELKRSIHTFRATVEKALTDVEIAHREVETAWSEVNSRFHAMTAAQNEANYLQDRFDVLPMIEDSATLLLEDLLDAFDRVADEESAFVRAQVAHAVAIIQLRQEVGTLLRTREGFPKLDSEQSRWMADRVRSRTSKATQQDGDLIRPEIANSRNSSAAVPVSRSTER